MAILGWHRGWDPFREMARLQGDLNNLFSGRYRRRGFWPQLRDFPLINVVSGADEVTVSIELPGMNSDNVDLSITGDTLTIRGERKPEADVDDGQYHRRERVTGAFVRTVTLPERVSADQAGARYRDGILTVTIPKSPDAKPRRIAVKTGE